MNDDTMQNIDTLDAPADAEIQKCLNLEAPKSFFLFAGAGSGKTSSLVAALNHIRPNLGPLLRLHGRRVAVVTYTTAARDEIIRRTEFDPLIVVSTIHSFAWTLIEGFTQDIREWLRCELQKDIEELIDKEARGRKGTQASRDRVAEIASKEHRLNRLATIQRFIYSPDTDNRGRDSLNHSEVLNIAGAFLCTKPTLQEIVRDGYPIIFVDESQDTNRHIVEALFELDRVNEGKIVIGLFGDMMQRIYGDGQPTLGQNLPPDWATPKKQLNFRCPQRIVRLINKVREATDGQKQIPKSAAIEGHVRMFIFPHDGIDKRQAEATVAAQMAESTKDNAWTNDNGIKVLILEHHMAARRMGFETMFNALQSIKQFRTGLLNGSLTFVSFFSNLVLPLHKAKHDKFAIARIVREASPLISVDTLRTTEDGTAQLSTAQVAVQSLITLLSADKVPTLRKVAQNITESGLFILPERIRVALDGKKVENPPVGPDPENPLDQRSDEDEAVDAFLETPYSEVEPYAQYVQRKARFDTHQGVKGLEFPRVMVIMDDNEARGFSFKYEKLFGPASDDDGSTLNATRRLFYVTCSRAERSLALVAYTKDPYRVREQIIAQGWLDSSEVQILTST